MVGNKNRHTPLPLQLPTHLLLYANVPFQVNDKEAQIQAMQERIDVFCERFFELAQYDAAGDHQGKAPQRG